MSTQQTFTGDRIDSGRNRPSTFLYCEECDEAILRSERFDHEHDLSNADAPTTAQRKQLEEKIPDHALVETQTWEITFHDTHVERVRVEAASQSEAKRIAEEVRTFDGELMDLGVHVEKLALGDKSQATIEYLEDHHLLPDDHDVTAEDIQKLIDAKEAGR